MNQFVQLRLEHCIFVGSQKTFKKDCEWVEALDDIVLVDNLKEVFFILDFFIQKEVLRLEDEIEVFFGPVGGMEERKVLEGVVPLSERGVQGEMEELVFEVGLLLIQNGLLNEVQDSGHSDHWVVALPGLDEVQDVALEVFRLGFSLVMSQKQLHFARLHVLIRSKNAEIVDQFLKALGLLEDFEGNLVHRSGVFDFGEENAFPILLLGVAGPFKRKLWSLQRRGIFRKN